MVVQAEATSTNANTGEIVEIRLLEIKRQYNVLLFYLIGSVVSERSTMGVWNSIVEEKCRMDGKKSWANKVYCERR